MTRLDRQDLILALLLAALAGYVDVIAFLSLGGFFASFMSGNSTRLAIGIASDRGDMIVALALILAFLGGVVLATLAGRRVRRRRRSATLGIVMALLLCCALTAQPDKVAPLLLLTAAMGAVNTLFERDGEVAVALTYMTGNLVRLGQAIAAALNGAPDIPRLITLTLMWSAFLTGGLSGALLYGHVALAALWGAVLLSGALTLWTATMRTG